MTLLNVMYTLKDAWKRLQLETASCTHFVVFIVACSLLIRLTSSLRCQTLMGKPFLQTLLTPYWITPVTLANGIQACHIWEGLPSLYTAPPGRHPFRIFSFSQPSKQQEARILSRLLSVIHTPSLPLLCSGELRSRMTSRDCLSCAEPTEPLDGHESCVFCLGGRTAPTVEIWASGLSGSVSPSFKVKNLPKPCRALPPALSSRAPLTPVSGSLPVSRPLMSSPPLTRRMWSPSELWKALRMMPFRWRRLQMTSAPTTRWITLTDYLFSRILDCPTAATEGDLHHIDVELLRVLSKAVDETRRPLGDPVYLSPFTSRMHNSRSSLLSSVDGNDWVGSVKLPPPLHSHVLRTRLSFHKNRSLAPYFNCWMGFI